MFLKNFSLEIKILSNVTWLCQICIKDDWVFDTPALREVTEWTTEQLASRSDCRRTSQYVWEFKTLYDAQKFETLFLLRWAR